MASLDNMPDHALEEIFSYLPVKSLIEGCKVSERWSELIKSSPKTMQRFRIYLNGYDFADWSINSIPGGRHVNLFISNFRWSDERAYELNDVIREQCSEPQTSIRSIQFLYGYYQKKPKSEMIKWQNLKSLKFENGRFRGVKSFLVAKPSKLEIIEASFRTSSFNALFCTDQAVHYKELRIIKSAFDEDKLIEIIKLKALNVVEFDLKYLTENVSVLQALSREYKWKTLKFLGVPFNLDIMKLIIESNPSVTKVLFNHVTFKNSEEILAKIAFCLPNIQHLRLPMGFGKFPKLPVQFARLHTLEIEAVRYPAVLVELIKMACPSLKTLRIYWIGGRAMKQQVLENILASAKELEELHLGAETDNFELTVEGVETIKAEGKKLRKLTVFTSCPDTMKKTLEGFRDTPIHATAWQRNHVKLEEMDENFGSQNDSQLVKKLISTCEFCM